MTTWDLTDLRQRAELAIVRKEQLTLDPAVVLALLEGLQDALQDKTYAESEIKPLQDKVTDLEIELAEAEGAIEELHGQMAAAYDTLGETLKAFEFARSVEDKAGTDA